MVKLVRKCRWNEYLFYDRTSSYTRTPVPSAYRTRVFQAFHQRANHSPRLGGADSVAVYQVGTKREHGMNRDVQGALEQLALLWAVGCELWAVSYGL